MIAFLLAAQAAGMAIDYFGSLSASQAAKEAAALKRREIEKQIQYSRLATADESLRAMINLRQNLGSQMAAFAAKGTAPGPATALFTAQSVSNFGTDERMRKINQLQTESQLRADKQISKMQEKTFENNQWNEFTKRTVNRIPTSIDAYKGIGSGFGLDPVAHKGSY